MKQAQKGGYGAGAGPVGYAWGPKPEMWPGVLAANGANLDGITASNFYELSPNGVAVGGVDIATPEVGQFGGQAVSYYARGPGSHAYSGGKKSKKAMSERKSRKSRKHVKGGKKLKGKKSSKSMRRGTKSYSKRRTQRKNKNKKGSRRHMKGGFGPQELINFGRDLKYWAKGAVEDYMGFQQPVDPSPLSQPIGQQYKVIEPNPTDLSKSYNRAGAAVAPL